MANLFGLLKSLEPASGEKGPAAGGCLATGCLHGLATGVVIGLGSAFLGHEGQLIVLPFLLFLGLAQWVYLAPLAVLLKRLGRTGVAKGFWIGGLLVALLDGLYWGGLGMYMVLHGIQSREIQRFAREHPITQHDVSGTVLALDAEHIEVQTSEGVVSIGLGAATHYIQRNGPFGNTRMEPDNVKVGVSVVVEASSFDGGPLYAEYVSMDLPQPESAPPH
jgi:hypothetical protein